MRTNERNISEFPAPAITICSNLFARNNSASFFKSYDIFAKRIPSNFSEEECQILAANIHWCQPAFGRMADKLCGQYDIEKIDVLKIINESALEVKKFENSRLIFS